MKSAIYYHSLRPGPGRAPFMLPDGRQVYIRATVEDLDMSGALDIAKPVGDEAVMNTHPLPSPMPPLFILLEGADGAGKSTLANQLSKVYGVPVHHEGPPPPEGDLLSHLFRVIERYAHTGGVIFDRLAIAESIYGPLLRGHDRLGEFGQAAIAARLAAYGAISVLCQPPYYRCFDAWFSRPENELVREPAMLREIWDRHAAMHDEFDFVYDWVHGADLFAQLLHLIDERCCGVEA